MIKKLLAYGLVTAITFTNSQLQVHAQPEDNYEDNTFFEETGDFVQQAATKGSLNVSENDKDNDENQSEEETNDKEKNENIESEQNITIVINEINSTPDDWVELKNIGSGDSIRVYDKNGTLIDEYSWSEHASYDGDDADWVEIYNAGTSDVDISRWYILDNELEKHKTDVSPVAEGTVLAPDAYFVFEEKKEFGFGLGKKDCATVYDKNGEVVASYEWTEHAAGVYARIPNGTEELVDYETSTKGYANLTKVSIIIRF